MEIALITVVQRAIQWWRGSGWGPRTVVLLGLAGVGLVGLSLVPGPPPDDAWLRDFLLTVGSSLALFAPFYLITRSLDRHLDQVAAETTVQVEGVRAEAAQRVAEVRREAAEDRSALSGEVDALRADVDRRLAETADRVTATLEAEAQADRAAFDSLRTDAPTREAVWEALERAQRLALTVAHRPPRVNASQLTRVYVAFAIDTGDLSDEPLELRVEGVSGATEDWVPWPAGRDAVDVLVEVGRALYKHTGETLDTRALLAGLADLLDAALSHPDRRPAIELCPPQWMVCDWGVVTYGTTSTRGAGKAQLRASSTIYSHFAAKQWVDQDSWEDAYEVAAALWPAADAWGSPAVDQPPF